MKEHNKQHSSNRKRDTTSSLHLTIHPLSKFCEHINHIEQETIDKANKQEKLWNTNIKKLKSACNKYGHESVHMFEKFNVAKCAAYLQYKRHECDVPMPKSVGEKRKCCMELMQWESLSSSLHAGDAKDYGAGISNPDLDVTDMLMGLSSSSSITMGYC